MNKRILILSVCLVLFFSVKNGFCAGSGAFRLEVPDAEALGKGSAFVAQADNPSAVYYNPAGLTQLKGKLNISLGATAVQPFNTYKDNSGNQTKMREQVFTIPSGYAVSNFGLEKLAFGIGSVSSWGLGTYWAEDSFSRYVATKTDLSTQSTMFTAAYEINSNVSFGVAVDYTRAHVDMRRKLYQGAGAGDFQVVGDENNAWGYRLSALYKLNEKHSFGFIYRSPVHLKYKGELKLNNLDASAPYAYSTVFGSSYETDVNSNTDLPQSMVLGYCFKPSDKWRFEFDVEWMDWATTKSTSYDYPNEKDPTRQAYLNNYVNSTFERNWHSVFSYALGTEYKINDKLKLRAGYFHHKSPIAQANFETSLPDSASNSVTLGAGYSFNKNVTLDFAYAAMFFNPRKITNDVGAALGGINGKYEAFTNLYALTLTFKL